MHCVGRDSCAAADSCSHIPSDIPLHLEQEDNGDVVCREELPLRLPKRSLSLSLRDSRDDLPLPVVAAPKVTPQLRSWRLTSRGLVEAVGQMGAFLDKPKTEKENDSGSGRDYRFAIGSMQGWRVDMEDAHVIRVVLEESSPFSEWSLLAVFDGHAGSTAASDAANHIVQSLLATSQFQKVRELLRSSGGTLTSDIKDLLEEGIKKGFYDLDDKIRDILDRLASNEKSGTTAVIGILTPSHIILGNLGDSRAVLSRRGDPSFGTEDHKPGLDKEKQRIISAGGSVMIQRINGSLAVSRALGDFEYKATEGLSPSRQQVSSEPDVYFIDRDLEKDEFLILACDGIFDVMSNDELSKFIQGRLRVQNDLNLVCNQVLDACLTKGSRDNMTLLLVAFAGAPSFDEAEAEVEKAMFNRISDAVNGILDEFVAGGQTRDEICVENVLRSLSANRSDAIPGEGSLRLLVRSHVEGVLAAFVNAPEAANGDMSP